MSKEVKVLLRDELVAKSGKARIEFLLYFEKKQYRISSSRKIEPKYWIHKSELVDKRSDDAVRINNYLSERLFDYRKYKSRQEALDEKMSLEDIKLILKGASLEELGNKYKKVYPTISQIFDEYVSVTKMRDGSKNNHRITKNVIVDFCKYKYRQELTIEKLDYNFLTNFVKYLREERDIPNGQGTISKRLRLLKTVIRYAMKTGLKVEDPFMNYPIENGKPKEIALTEKEYIAIKRTILPIGSCNSLKLTKHIFTFCCETGLRYSDAMDLSWNHVDEQITSLEKVQVKTSNAVFVPISKQAKELMIAYRNKYHDSENHVFPRIDIQVMNRYLKELAKIAGISKNLTSHVARHTFGTRLGASGKVSAYQICELMGHTDVKMSQRYINLSKDDLRKTMARVWEN